MSFKLRLLRIAGLLGAAVALPCCSGDVGKGDTFSIITFRASETPTGVQGNGPSSGGSFSDDGRFFAFHSDASNLTANDSNGVTDILVKERLTGAIENITNIDVAGTNLVVGNSTDPSLSATGRYVGFVSVGHYKDVGYPPPAAAIVRPFRYDRELKTFATVYMYLTTPPQFLNSHTGAVVLSDDGRYMAFSTTATNIGTTNPNGWVQVYFCDFGPTGNTPDITLISHAAASLTQGGNGSSTIRPGSLSAMSGDGEFVVFDSTAADLLPSQDSHYGSDVYLWRRSTGALTLLSTPSSNLIYSVYGGISKDGTRAAFSMTDASLLPAPNHMRCELVTVATGFRQTISDPVAGGNVTTPVVLSRDGKRIIFGSGPFFFPQQDLWIEGVGIQRLTRSTTGQTTTVTTGYPAISPDGRWTSWSGASSLFVPNDNNGFSDAFIRGPF
jgi:hypothetical protein